MSFLSPRPLSEDELARFPSFVRAGRALLGVTQQRLAQAAGLSLATLNNLEREVHTPRGATLEAIAEVLALHGVVFSNEQGRAHLSYHHAARPEFQSPAPGETRLDLMRMWESQLAPTSLLACDSVLFYAFDKPSGAPAAAAGLPPARGFGIYLRAGTRQLLWDRAELSLADQTKAAEFGHLMTAACHFAAEALFFIPHPLPDTRAMRFTEAVEFLSQQDQRPLDHPLPLCLLLAAWDAIETWVRQSDHPIRALMLLAEADADMDAEAETGVPASGPDRSADLGSAAAGLAPAAGGLAGGPAGGTSRKRPAKSSRTRESPAPRASASGKARKVPVPKVPLSSGSPSSGPPAGFPPAPPELHPGLHPPGPHLPGPHPDGAYAFQEGTPGGGRPLPLYPAPAPPYPYAPGFYAPGYAPGSHPGPHPGPAPPGSHPLPPGVPGVPGVYAPAGAYPHPAGVPSPPYAGPYASGLYSTPGPAPGVYPPGPPGAPGADGRPPEAAEKTPEASRVPDVPGVPDVPDVSETPSPPDAVPPRPSRAGPPPAADPGEAAASPSAAGDEEAHDPGDPGDPGESASDSGYDEENWI